MEKTEMNKVIAEFDGVKFNGTWWEMPSGRFEPEVWYDTSWDWLMPVFDKIRLPLVEPKMELAKAGKYEEASHYRKHEKAICNAVIMCDLTEAHKAIFEAITYLNSKQ